MNALLDSLGNVVMVASVMESADNAVVLTTSAETAVGRAVIGLEVCEGGFAGGFRVTVDGRAWGQIW